MGKRVAAQTAEPLDPAVAGDSESDRGTGGVGAAGPGGSRCPVRGTAGAVCGVIRSGPGDPSDIYTGGRAKMELSFEDAAKAVGVPMELVGAARFVSDAAPDLEEAVRAGAITISDALIEIAERLRLQLLLEGE